MEKLKTMITNGIEWPMDKDLEDFNALIYNLRNERLHSRADCVEYLIERIKLLEKESSEMLDALIKIYKTMNIIEHPPGDNCPLCIIENIIEKATGLKIEEILEDG